MPEKSPISGRKETRKQRSMELMAFHLSDAFLKLHFKFHQVYVRLHSSCVKFPLRENRFVSTLTYVRCFLLPEKKGQPRKKKGHCNVSFNIKKRRDFLRRILCTSTSKSAILYRLLFYISSVLVSSNETKGSFFRNHCVF